ncbi:PfkB family carbohydrate kinase [Mangrovibacterium lignilyticum]|uniref:PfkB family carbohydrate kinase n=1 Tax=Mangrovibacterium lignilyticum TaxID=2668052 RepID=UPI0013D18EEB|nr:PfkB family carbohydrate kinase [Mangrovibacterium lignilyticum]
MPQVLFAGLTTLDMQYQVDQFPGSNEKVKCKPPDILVGGPAANAAAAFAFLNGDSLLLTAIGANSFYQFIDEDFKRFGIRAIDFIEGKKVNPVFASVITSSNGDRTILSHHPENHKLDLSFADLLIEEKPAAILVDGFYPDMTLSLCRAAKEQNITTIFDGGSWKPHLSDLIPLLDLVICSAEFMPPGCSTHQDVFEYFRNQGITQIAISRGEKSILYCEGGDIQEIQTVNQQIIDSLGAGDFLHGAFCYYWLKDRNFKTSLAKAGKIATATCNYTGTRNCFKELQQSKFR